MNTVTFDPSKSAHFIYKQLSKESKKITNKVLRDEERKFTLTVKNRISEFKVLVSQINDKLGKAKIYKPTEFHHRSGWLEKHTGYIIRLDNKVCCYKNMFIGAKATFVKALQDDTYKKVPIAIPKIIEEHFPISKPDKNNLPLTNHAGRNWKIHDINITVFYARKDVDYGTFVNNPERKDLKTYRHKGGRTHRKGEKYNYYAAMTGRKPGETWAGTGWFDFYSSYILQAFLSIFNASSFQKSKDELIGELAAENENKIAERKIAKSTAKLRKYASFLPDTSQGTRKGGIQSSDVSRSNLAITVYNKYTHTNTFRRNTKEYGDKGIAALKNILEEDYALYRTQKGLTIRKNPFELASKRNTLTFGRGKIKDIIVENDFTLDFQYPENLSSKQSNLAERINEIKEMDQESESKDLYGGVFEESVLVMGEKHIEKSTIYNEGFYKTSINPHDKATDVSNRPEVKEAIAAYKKNVSKRGPDIASLLAVGIPEAQIPNTAAEIKAMVKKNRKPISVFFARILGFNDLEEL